MADLINLGCDCCGECGFGCNPCIDSVDLSICGNIATFAWPLEADGCGRVYAVAPTVDACSGLPFSPFIREDHRGCTHEYNTCLGYTSTIDPIVTYTGGIGDCGWKYEVYGYAARLLSFSVTFAATRRLIIAAQYAEHWILLDRTTITKGYCTATRGGFLTIGPGQRDPCNPCTVSGDVRIVNRMRFVKDFSLENCSSFFDAISLDLDTISTPSISWTQRISVGGTICQCSNGPFGSLETNITVTIPSMPWQNCVGTSATLQFNEGP